MDKRKLKGETRWNEILKCQRHDKALGIGGTQRYEILNRVQDNVTGVAERAEDDGTVLTNPNNVIPDLIRNLSISIDSRCRATDTGEPQRQEILNRVQDDVKAAAGRPKAAFTLAEVLISLAIIGIVAAMTLPTIINKYQKRETVSKLISVYSLISQAMKRAEIDYGYLDYWDFSLDSQEFSDKYIKPYFLVIQEYKTGEVPANTHNYCLNGSICDGYFGYFNLPKIIIKNGTSLTIRTTASGNGTRFLTFIVDLNSLRKPNTYGKDLFAFSVSAGGQLVPYGVGDVVGGTVKIGYNRDELANGSDHRTCNKNKGGAFCAALIFMDGWKISDDYPWD